MSGTGNSTKSISTTGNQRIDGVLSNVAWADSSINYSFSLSGAPYSYAGTGSESLPLYFNTISNAQASAIHFALNDGVGPDAADGFSVEGFTTTTITALGAVNSTTAEIRFGQTYSSAVTTARVGDFPGNYVTGPADDNGDVWFGSYYNYRAPVAGDYSWATHIHEIGHALGLTHGHQTFQLGALPYAYDSMEYSVMTYRSYVGASTSGGYTNETYGFAQTWMMSDIAALQHMYGADFTSNGGNTVYKWNPNSGDTLVNGAVGIDAGANRIFATIWDGNGIDTYDLSSYSTNLSINLQPGEHSYFNAAQIAHLGNGNYARGNIFNAMQYNGDARSLIENAIGGSGNDTIIGNAANNTLTGGAGNDTLTGGDGNDILRGGSGNDTYSGGAGDDTIYYGTGDNFWIGGSARNVGGTGTDTLIVEAGSFFQTASLGAYGFERFIGNAGSDRITGLSDSVSYFLSGGGGNDVLTGAGGNDTIIGGSGSDTMWGHGGNDTIHYSNGDAFWDSGGAARNVGGSGTDTLVVEAGSTFSTSALGAYGFERFIGNNGNDRVTGQLDSVNYRLNGGAGNDVLTGSGGDDTIVGGAGSDVMSGRGGNDWIFYANGDNFWFDSGAARNVGGSGTDTLVVEAGSYFNTAALGSYGLERFIGNSGSDRVTGQLDSVNYHLDGGAGNDELVGSGGNDTIIGGAGADLMSGRGGDDRIHYTNGDNFWFSSGAARNVGGSGRDTLIIEAGSYFNTAALSSYGFERFIGNSGSDRVTGQLNGVDYHLDGGSGNDELTGSGGNDTIIGGAGSDLMWGRGGNDTIHYSNGDRFWEGNGAARNVGGTGTDTLVVQTGSYFHTAALSSYGFERFIGNSGSDRVTGNLDGVNYYLDGGAGNDVLTGSGGNDTIIGGTGSDLMMGHGGNDTIHYSTGDNFWHSPGVARDVGGSGRDTLVIEAGSSFSTSALSAYGFERFIGNSGRDVITGQLDSVNYHLEGGGGNDVLTGSAGNDTIIGGTGFDLMMGYGGNDTIHYSNGDNFWHSPGVARNVGGTGTDTLVVEAGSSFSTSALSAYGFERFIGNSGRDVITGQLDSVNYHLEGGAGNDVLAGSGGKDTIIGGAGSDEMWGRGGDDRIHYSNGDSFWDSPGVARNVGGDGVDTLLVEAGSYFRTSALSSYGFERFIGNQAADHVRGQLDSVNYHLDGGAGNDRLTGSGGNDRLIDGLGNDILTGGTGSDTFDFRTLGYQETITDFEDTVDIIELSRSGLSFANLIISQSGADTFISFAGNGGITLENFNSAQLSSDDFNFV